MSDQHVVEGLLPAGEIMTAMGRPGSGLTWMALGLAASVAFGKDWFGKATSRGEVLLVNADLHPETIAERMRMIRQSTGVPDSDLDTNIELVALRGKPGTITEIAEWVERQTDPGQYRLIVVDPLWRLLVPAEKGAPSIDIDAAFECLDRIAAHSRAAVFVTHPSTEQDEEEDFRRLEGLSDSVFLWNVWNPDDRVPGWEECCGIGKRDMKRVQ